MQVTIRHRQVDAGVTLPRQDHYVDCRVDFNEEEKAIILTRGLGSQYSLTVPSAMPMGAGMDMRGGTGGCLKVVGIISGGLGVLFLLALAADGNIVPPILIMGIFFILVSVACFGTMISAQSRRNTSFRDQSWTLGQFVANPTFTVYAADFDQAKYYDELIRMRLSEIKDAITRNIELKQTETFEL